MELNERWKAAEEAAKLAGKLIYENRPANVTQKGRNDFVTEMDVRSERTIREYLLSRFPEDAFYGEEGGKSGTGKYMWIVDPIDGTTNYIKGIPAYTVSIGLSVSGEWTLGCVYAPAMDELFSACLGKGAYLNGKPIGVSGEDDLKKAVVGMSFAHRNAVCGQRMLALLPALTSRTNDLRRMGSAAYDLCMVACGRLDAFMELDLNAYDIAAGSVIAREAGATVGGWAADEDYRETGNILSASPLLFDELRSML